MIGIIGAIAGDAIGVPYEFYQGENIKTKEFDLIKIESRVSDDTAHTIAVADWLMNTDRSPEALSNLILEYTRTYSGYGFGGMMFKKCIEEGKLEPYGSWGNGSAMRVSPVAWVTDNFEECMELAEKSASVSHNHIEGIKGAQATAAAVWLNRKGYTKEFVKSYIEDEFGYNLSRTVDEIRQDYHFYVSCQKSVPESIICWLESTSYEDCIRNTISLGGDADTMACIAGGICNANPETQISDELVIELFGEYDRRLDNHMRDILNKFHETYEML